MAEALSRLIPNADCRLSLVIRHRQDTIPRHSVGQSLLLLETGVKTLPRLQIRPSA